MKEIEYKFITTLPVPEIKHIVECIARNTNFSLTPWKESDRVFTYYDTPTRDLLRTGRTLREVSGFEKGVRYDYKSGPIVDRNESSVWTEGKDIAPMLTALGRPELKDIPMHYDKCIMHKDGTTIECGIDTTPHFTEVEFELEDGNRHILDTFSKVFATTQGFTPSDVQKYLRTWVMQEKQLRDLQQIQQQCRWHTDTVLEHTLQTVLELQTVLQQFPLDHSYELFLATVYHDVGKQHPQHIDGYIKFPGHEFVGSHMAHLDRYDLSSTQEEKVRGIIKEHGLLGKVLLRDDVTGISHLQEQARLSLADLRASNLQRDYPAEYANREHKLIDLMK